MGAGIAREKEGGMPTAQGGKWKKGHLYLSQTKKKGGGREEKIGGHMAGKQKPCLQERERKVTRSKKKVMAVSPRQRKKENGGRQQRNVVHGREKETFIEGTRREKKATGTQQQKREPPERGLRDLHRSCLRRKQKKKGGNLTRDGRQ